MRTNFVIQECKNTRNKTNRISKGKFKRNNNKIKIFKFRRTTFNLQAIKKHENMFDGTLENCTGTEYKIELLEGAQPYHTKSFPIP